MNSKPSPHLIVLGVLVLLSPLSALYGAWIYSSIWDLLVRPQYGAGPTYESWYGIALFVSLALMHVKSEGKDDEPATTLIVRALSRATLMLFVLGLAHGVHAVLGW